MKKILLIAGLLLIISAMPALAAEPENIKSFHSRIVVNQDSSIIVTETILVHAAGDQIKRGIYRDFPTIYTNVDGNKYKVGFKVISVKRDGQPENYHQDSIANGVRVYFGREEYILPEGDYTYEFTYRATNELGFYSDHDELYWNVTGNGWAFPIEKASAEVILPSGILTPDIRMAVYSGAMGERGGGNLELVNGAVPTFSTTKPLSVGEGLTIVVGWPKGFVSLPLSQNKEFQKQIDELRLIFGLVGVFLLIAYYLWAWYRVGRDPKKGVVIPQYDPPRGLSPASLGFVWNGGYDRKHFTATIIAMAIRKILTIELLPKKYLQKNKYQLSRTGANTALSPEESIISKKIFVGGQTVAIEQKNSLKFILAGTGLKSYLAKSQYAVHNYAYLIIGVIISIIIFAAGSNCQGYVCDLRAKDFAILILPLVIFAYLSAYIISILKKSLREKKSNMEIFGLVSSAIVVMGVTLGIAFAFYMLSDWRTTALFIILLIMDISFYFLLRRNTVDGQKLLEEIEGFIWFMTVTEKDRMNFHNPPERTPELFEKYLPYALALGVENKWAKQFDEVFARLKEQGAGYIPAWYLAAGMHDFNPSDLTAELSRSFSGAISSASMAPGSASGFGGGFSGGGGGGGGGGGW